MRLHLLLHKTEIKTTRLENKHLKNNFHIQCFFFLRNSYCFYLYKPKIKYIKIESKMVKIDRKKFGIDNKRDW